jgi:radical SAM protein with 4Fe4S-binding SPASM domain
MQPDDLVLVPLAAGGLLVSPSRGRFLRVEPGQVARLRSWLNGTDTIDEVSARAIERAAVLGRVPVVAPSRPRILLQLTNACNFTCAYCHCCSGQPRPSEISAEQARDIVSSVADRFGTEADVSLSGGEPLLVPFAIDLAEFVLDLGLGLTLLTNGALIAELGLANRLARLTERGAKIRISFAGTSPAACDATSQGRRFEPALAGIGALLAAGGKPMVDLVLLASDVEETIEHAAEFAERLANEVAVRVGTVHLGGRARPEHVFRSAAELGSALERLGERAGVDLSAAQGAPILPRDGVDCALGQSLHVRSDGALFTCHRMATDPVAELRDQSFAVALATVSSFGRPARSLPRCRSCPFVRICAGGCRTENHLITGNRDHPACGPWRVQVLGELLAAGRIEALGWPTTFLAFEARRRGFDVPELTTIPGSVSGSRPGLRSSPRHLPLVLPTAIMAGAVAAACNPQPTESPTASASPSSSLTMAASSVSGTLAIVDSNVAVPTVPSASASNGASAPVAAAGAASNPRAARHSKSKKTPSEKPTWPRDAVMGI